MFFIVFNHLYCSSTSHFPWLQTFFSQIYEVAVSELSQAATFEMGSLNHSTNFDTNKLKAAKMYVAVKYDEVLIKCYRCGSYKRLI